MIPVRRIFELLCIVEIERFLKAPQRRFSVDFGLCFLKDFQAILYDEFDGPLREVVHLFGADPKERLPTELFDTLEPRLLPRKKFGRVLPILDAQSPAACFYLLVALVDACKNKQYMVDFFDESRGGQD